MQQDSRAARLQAAASKDPLRHKNSMYRNKRRRREGGRDGEIERRMEEGREKGMEGRMKG